MSKESRNVSARTDLSSILRCTANLMEPITDAEVADFFAHVRVDMTLSPQDALSFVLEQLKSLGVVEQNEAGRWHVRAVHAVAPSRVDGNQRPGYTGAVTEIFQFAPPGLFECEAPRKLRLRVSSELGAGLHLRPSWHGMIVDEIEDSPGQPDLRLGDCIRQIQAPQGPGPPGATGATGATVTWQRLHDLDLEDCELLFAQSFQDGAQVLLEPHCETSGNLPKGLEGLLDASMLRADLASFSTDFDVELHLCWPTHAARHAKHACFDSGLLTTPKISYKAAGHALLPAGRTCRPKACCRRRTSAGIATSEPTHPIDIVMRKSCALVRKARGSSSRLDSARAPVTNGPWHL